MILAPTDFNLEATLDSAQVFGFRKSPGGVYEGALDSAPVRLWQSVSGVHVEGDVSEKAVREYFDLDRDMSGVYSILESDDRLAQPLRSFRGLRLIRQSSWESLAGFIISANNNFKRIQLIWTNLARAFGPSEFHFPEPEMLASSSEAKLREAGLGYRAPYLHQTAKIVAANPVILYQIRAASYLEARERIQTFPGVGPKVADCALLYGFQKYEAFPVDVWIHRAIRTLYFRGRKVSEKRAAEFGRRRWGPNAGFIQQYLFHGARTGMLEG
ncbi:MAG: hypothetical protein HY586_02045 [Candidatus Omnitrophica bacterium]|nr:hypothetical protein [Candidatus Omnitrophota bacterium]